ncbi:3-hydroxyisobutyrate dehydrogenase [Mycolicibacterium canariasense]|uniref:3-hydroxyisobutyrate dehydrogenase n=1 Tax=Mycolicibacterium canariasense TaxID=228230 RepID=A0A100W986_MYCCR|nr:NAD(P)-dependent oxidoreductase [Mycolicibacterium canariasense]MCV7212836.1 NAD(P)-dependent oxidoreductase [Mycolicibacterium canariasense]ORV12559.1 hypothetical protein AWB94_05625 [Mycolicibacterium canariasense]GAS93808.1 3-hydroxyisobutyrate dehydrogenase [Mycolicibacterium canariasense]
MSTVAVLGTGNLGAAICRRLLETGFDVRAWNRTPSTATPLAEAGATVASSVADAVAGAPVVIIAVFDAAAVLDVLQQMRDELADGAVVAQTATVGLEIATVARTAQQLGIELIDVAVLGNQDAARAGKLTVLAAAAAAVRGRVSTTLAALASSVMWVGDAPGPASALKLACNSWVAGLNAILAQAMSLTRSFGIDPSLFLEAITGTAADSPYLQAKAAIMLGDGGQTVTTVDSMRKDLQLIVDAARAHGVSDVLLDAQANLYRTASDRGYGGSDIALVERVFGEVW